MTTPKMTPLQNDHHPNLTLKNDHLPPPLTLTDPQYDPQIPDDVLPMISILYDAI